MNRNPGRVSQRGFTLTEVMVATAIMIVIFVAILMLYDNANKIFKTSNESADMQQNLRVAYDRLIADVRMAGFDYKRGGPMMPGQTAAAWAPARDYAAGTIVTPTTPNGHTYRATTSGTSSNSEPAWPVVADATIVEFGATPPITWQENGAAVYEQPDEQIEFAGETAITMRSNYDYSAGQAGDVDHGREPALELASDGHFPLVTTGNDEIVTYALVSNRAAAGVAPNNQSIEMYLDINSGGSPTRTAHPGGDPERLVRITGVDLTNDNPPYTLYRFTFDNQGTVQRTPLADNIRSLNFFYFADSAGQVALRDADGDLAPNIGGGGQYNPTVAGSWNAPERLVRSRIRSIRVRLIGMSPAADRAFNDDSVETGMYNSTDSAGVPEFVADTVTPHNRRVAADTVVSPRNLGMTGLPQNFLTPPPAPTITSVCSGYCAVTVINWNPNTTNPNASYVVLWDTDENGSFSNALDAGTSNTFAVDLTQHNVSGSFYFKVRADNAGGSATSESFGPVSARNDTTPNLATNIAATGGATPALPGVVRLTWTAPVTNAGGTVSCTTGSPSVSTYLREIKGFRIYRSTNPNVPIVPANLQVDENTSGVDAPNTDGYGNYTWEDRNVSCGNDYYYRVITVEWCAADPAYNTSNNASSAVSDASPSTASNGIAGRPGSSGTPAVAVNLQTAPPAPAEPPLGMIPSTCDNATNNCAVSIRWSKVTIDTANNPIAIDEYELERTQYLLGVPVGPAVTIPISGALALPDSYVTHIDNVPEHDPVSFANYSYQYRVRAVQDFPCPSGVFGDVAHFPPPCTFTGSVVVQTGASSGDGLTPASSWVMAAGDSIQVVPPAGTTLTSTTMRVIDGSGNLISTETSLFSPAPFGWDSQTPGEVYMVTLTMTNDATPPCTEQLVRYIQQEPLPACAVTTFSEQNSILLNTATTYQLKLDLINEGAEAMNLTALRFNWTQPNRIQWQNVKFPSTATATVVGPGTTSGDYTVILSPRPGQLSPSDVTVNASGTRSILLNMARTNGNPANITPAVINSICVQYTLVSQPGFTFSCQIKPDADAANPTSCN